MEGDTGNGIYGEAVGTGGKVGIGREASREDIRWERGTGIGRKANGAFSKNLYLKKGPPFLSLPNHAEMLGEPAKEMQLINALMLSPCMLASERFDIKDIGDFL